MDDAIAFDERGLVACVVQDWTSGEVLTLAYMNREALARTRATGELHLFSRSRQELWHKGATSGHTQAVKALRLDCDGDAVLALVEPAGPPARSRPVAGRRRGGPRCPPSLSTARRSRRRGRRRATTTSSRCCTRS